MGETGLNEDQQEFLAQCEEEFAERFTENDKEFMKLKNETPRTPPIVDPWYNKPRRPHYDWSRQNREQGRNERRNHHSDRRNNDRNDRYDRHAGKHHLYQRNSRPY
ncbi:RNA guanine-N7 methyltransferase activating subunit [Venturia canescens]|uniref:RNA guanine-N7 methyltransferase activating subunit n=1 Tax=Venturia canescens TaxID=32260 RepID=UPI001C9D3157|nr:RNA guanine-N7 methyltransferase activating subunit [Venturia canescens]